ncbi:unnamed protein product, partial [Rotaria sp. Silwood2]
MGNVDRQPVALELLDANAHSDSENAERKRSGFT